MDSSFHVSMLRKYTCFLNGPFTASFFVFVTVNSKYVYYEILPMTGFEPWTSSMRIDWSANWATTTTASWCTCSNDTFVSNIISEKYERLRVSTEFLINQFGVDESERPTTHDPLEVAIIIFDEANNQANTQ